MPLGDRSGSASGGARRGAVVAGVSRTLARSRSWSASQRAASRLRQGATSARPSPPAQPNDPLWSDSWSLDEGSGSRRLARDDGRRRDVVAVLDTGIDRDQADLQGAFVEGWDAVNEDADPATITGTARSSPV